MEFSSEHFVSFHTPSEKGMVGCPATKALQSVFVSNCFQIFDVTLIHHKRLYSLSQFVLVQCYTEKHALNTQILAPTIHPPHMTFLHNNELLRDANKTAE